MNTYKVGHSYIDNIANSKDQDQFVNFLPGMGNSGGIRPVKYKNLKSPLPAYVVLITSQLNHRSHNPWDDIIDYVSGKIYYWGDAKFNIYKKYKEFMGNLYLERINDTVLDANFKDVPPILHFSKSEKGKVIFNGLCVINKLDMTWYEDNDKPVKNYRAELTILDEDEINVDWLNSRAKSVDLNETNNLAPSAWKEYIKGRVKKLDLYKKEIKSTEEQLPDSNSEDAKVLEKLVELSPVQFEAVIVEMFKMQNLVHHNIYRTRHVKDGGFDFIGEFVIPYPLHYKIQFLGEVKRYSRKNGVGPEMISRLVARLGRGQYGVFITTSFYTRQAQAEVLEDGYPVRLYNGKDLINFLRESRLIKNGTINKKWIDLVTASV